MIRCKRCGRRMKHSTPSGLGPKCESYARPAKAQRKAGKAMHVRRDKLTPDLFEGAV